MRPTRPAPAAVCAAAAMATGCGSESAEPSELAATLPGDPEVVTYLDLDAAREALSLPEDADPADQEALDGLDQDDPLVEFFSVSGSALPHVSDALTRTFELDATGLAIDHAQVSAAATSRVAEGGPVEVLQSDQSFDEVAEELEDTGFEQDGDVLSGESADPKPALPYVADAGDGRIVIASTREQADGAIAGGDEEPSESIALLDDLDQPQRAASGISSEGSCLTGFAVGGEVGGGGLEIVLQVDGEADADRVAGEVPALAGESPPRLGEPTVDGDLVAVTASAPTAEEGASGAELVAGGFIAPEALYDCG